MKLNINKASDLSSLSVLPNHYSSGRRSNAAAAAATGAESSMFGKSQASQLRSQQSQQSFSHSSQHGLFSQISSNSIDDVNTNGQRVASQERESSARKGSCLPPTTYPREDSQMQVQKSNTTTLMRKLSFPEHKCQVSEELEHRIGMMETSLSRFGMILDSIQSDIMQANKGTKEAALEIFSIRQKMVVFDDSLQSMNKGLEDIKVCFERESKALSDQFKQIMLQQSSRQSSLQLSALPGKVETCILKLQNELIKSFTREIQEMTCSLKVNQRCSTPVVHAAKDVKNHAASKKVQFLNSMPVHSQGHRTSLPKIKMGSWKTVKQKIATSKDKIHDLKKSIKKRASPIQLDRGCKIMLESDEDIDGDGFSFFKENKRDIGIYSIEDAQKETERILRKARRRKRKHNNTIILD